MKQLPNTIQATVFIVVPSPERPSRLLRGLWDEIVGQRSPRYKGRAEAAVATPVDEWEAIGLGPRACAARPKALQSPIVGDLDQLPAEEERHIRALRRAGAIRAPLISRHP